MAWYRDWKCPSCKAISPDVPTSVPDQFCPYCGTEMEKVWTANTFLFKGDGWSSPTLTIRPESGSGKEN